MHPAARALWYIEAHLDESGLTLDSIAETCAVSRFHLTRAFGLETGWSVMAYLRARRLSEAARRLATGASDILTVAIDSGYSSHEAFTRAFRDQFGQTPETVRALGNTASLKLLEPIKMNEQLQVKVDSPRFVDGQPLLLAGLSERYDQQSSANIPSQWQRFVPLIGTIPGQKEHATYGVVYNSDDAGNTDYLSGVPVEDFSRTPAGLTTLRIGARRYAVFTHLGHVAGIRSVWNAIFREWLPASGCRLADAPMFERYGEAFNPVSGLGGFEIWIPVDS